MTLLFKNGELKRRVYFLPIVKRNIEIKNLNLPNIFSTMSPLMRCLVLIHSHTTSGSMCECVAIYKWISLKFNCSLHQSNKFYFIFILGSYFTWFYFKIKYLLFIWLELEVSTWHISGFVFKSRHIQFLVFQCSFVAEFVKLKFGSFGLPHGVTTVSQSLHQTHT